MNVKKVLMVLISLCLVCGMAGAVSAEDMNYEGDGSHTFEPLPNYNGTSTVLLNTTTVKPGFTLSIPDTIELTKQDDGLYGTDASVELKNIVYVSNIYINVSVTSSNTWILKEANGFEELGYNMTAVNEDGSEIGTVNPDSNNTFERILKVTTDDLTDGKNSAKTTLKFNTLSPPQLNAEYTDTLTFTVIARLHNVDE